MFKLHAEGQNKKKCVKEKEGKFFWNVWALEALVLRRQWDNLSGWYQEDFRSTFGLWVHEEIIKSSLSSTQKADV